MNVLHTFNISYVAYVCHKSIILTIIARLPINLFQMLSETNDREHD